MSDSDLRSKVLVDRPLSRWQRDTDQSDGETSRDAIVDRSSVSHPKAGPAEERIEPIDMSIVVTGIRGAQAQPSLEALVEREPVHGAGVPVALVRHQQPSAASHPEVVISQAVHDTDDDVVGRETSSLAVAQATDREARRERRCHMAVPLVQKLDGGDDDEHLTSPGQFVRRCRDAEHGLAGSGHRLDHAAVLGCRPTGEGIVLPRVQPGTVECSCSAARDLKRRLMSI